VEAAVDRQQLTQRTTGAALITIGVALLAAQLEWSPLWQLHRLWPLALVVIGLPKLLWGDEHGRRAGGLWLTSFGALFMLHTFRIVTIRDSWPLFIVVIGVSMILATVGQPAPKKGA
jgi:hypothetical protein